MKCNKNVQQKLTNVYFNDYLFQGIMHKYNCIYKLRNGYIEIDLYNLMYSNDATILLQVKQSLTYISAEHYLFIIKLCNKLD